MGRVLTCVVSDLYGSCSFERQLLCFVLPNQLGDRFFVLRIEKFRVKTMKQIDIHISTSCDIQVQCRYELRLVNGFVVGGQ